MNTALHHPVIARLRQLAPLLLAACVLAGNPALAGRIKEVAAIEGVRSNQLTGFGLVIGLDGPATRPRRCPTPRRA
jgi:flagellar P-ring protein precursor FlgI